jgi:hypothetical protein
MHQNLTSAGYCGVLAQSEERSSLMPVRHRIPPALFFGFAAALLWSAAAFGVVASKPKVHKAGTVAGAWSGKYSGPVSGTFTLHWTQTGSTLTGSITLTSPPGKYGINGHVNGSAIQFGAVGAGATYTGSVSGTSMSGNWKSSIGGGTWSAHKT